MKVQELEGAELDLLVAKAEGWTFFRNKRDGITIRQPGIAESNEVGNYRAKFDRDTGAPIDPITEVAAFSEIGAFFPSSDWSHGGPIIERERITLMHVGGPDGFWNAGYEPEVDEGSQCESGWIDLPAVTMTHECSGPTPLIAAMRAYVAAAIRRGSV